MAPPIGNQFWKLRAKHGRDAIIGSPEILWESACEYFEWCQKNPLKEQNWVGKDGDEVYKELMRPFTQAGLCIYLGISEQTFRDFRNKNDFIEVYNMISQIIKNQKFEGAAVGLFNANIIARDLGLKDNQDVTTNGQALNKYEVTLKL